MDAEKLKKGAFEISVIEIKDLSSIKKIEMECGLSRWSVEDYRNELKRPGSVHILIRREEKTVGFLIARLITSKDAELYNIGVEQTHRRAGIGRMLLEYFIAHCQESAIENIWLEVRESNAVASSFYRQFGFQVAGQRKNFYQEPVETAQLLNLSLIRGLAGEPVTLD